MKHLTIPKLKLMGPVCVALLAIAALFLDGCVKRAWISPTEGQFARPDDADMRRFNDLSEAHIEKLQKAYTGREFVFRMNWKTHKVFTEDKKEVHVLAGTVARIRGLNTTDYKYLYVLFESEDGKRGVIPLELVDKRTANEKAWVPTPVLTDDIVTEAWIDRKIAPVVEYLEAPGLSREAVALPEAKEGLVLTPPPETGTPGTPPSEPQQAIHNLKALAEPARVSPGGEVRLLLSFTVVAEGMPKAEVEEKRTLEFNGNALPQFPVTRKVARPAGKHTSTYRQKIPKSAKPGPYLFRGEVCIQNACSSHSAEFELQP